MSDLGSPILNSVHMTLGMNTEINGELPEAIDNNDLPNILEELGDCQWYMANYANIWNLTLPEDVKFEPEVYMNLDASHTIALLQDLDKKELAYPKIAPIEERQRLLLLLLKQVEGIALVNGVDTDDMREKNIAKLKARYGEKFSTAAAIERKLDVERAILEGV